MAGVPYGLGHATLRQALPMMGALLAFFPLLSRVAVRFYHARARARPTQRPLPAGPAARLGP